jgi:uncharacterized membrane protein YecN with MAPEG domain
MSAFPITSLYAALLALLLMLLSARTSLLRRATGIDFGFGEDRRLLRAIRAQANFVEYAPMGLLLLLLLEARDTPPGLLYILGGAILGGRLLHPLGISPEPERLILRQLGMVLTFGALSVGSVLLLVGLWPALFGPGP